MRALRSRNVQSDSGNEQITEESEHVTEEIITKHDNKKKSKKHLSDSETTEQVMEGLKYATAEYISKKVKRRKPRTHITDRISNEHMMVDSEHGTETETTLPKPPKRKKSKKHTSYREISEHMMQDSEHGTETETPLPKRLKRKKSKKHTSDKEIDGSVMQNSEHGIETETTVSKKVKRKKSKKHTSDENDPDSDKEPEEKISKKKNKKRTTHVRDNPIAINETETISNINTETQEATVNSGKNDSYSDEGRENKISKKKNKKRTRNIENNPIAINETETILNINTETREATENSGKNDSYSDEGRENKISKKKNKKRTRNIENNPIAINRTETASNIIIETKEATENPGENDSDSDKGQEKKISKKKNKKRTTHIEDNPTSIYETETVSNINTETQEAAENPSEKMMIIKSKKPREFLRSTIFNTPKFDTVITSTVMKPKKPEINFEECEIDDGFENKSLQKINKVKKTKSEQKIERPSKIIEDNKKDFDMVPNRRETYHKMPKNNALNGTDNSIVFSKTIIKTKRSTLTICNTTGPEGTDRIIDSFESNSPNKSKKQEIFPRRTTFENTLNCSRDSVSNRRETFNKTPKNRISNDIDSVIAISDSLEISKLKQNSLNKTNLAEPEITSDEEMITDDSLEQQSLEVEENKRMFEPNRSEIFSKLPKNKILSAVENTIITISDSPEKSNLKQNTFNKSETEEPEVTSDEDNETNEIIPNKINESTKSKSFDQSLNRTKTKESLELETHNNTNSGRVNTFCKTPKNTSSPISEKLLTEDNNLLEAENDKEYEGLSDVSASILDDVIDISDSPEKTKFKESTFNLSSNSANNTINKSNSDIKKSNDTFDVKVVNTSGNWQVEKSQVDIINENVDNKLNDTFDVENKENSQRSNSSKGNSTIIINENTLKNENISLSPTDISIRKKWLKFPRHSTDAQIILDQISSPKLQKKMKIVEKIMSTPTDLYKIQNQSVVPSNLCIPNKSFKKSPLKSIKKSGIKSIVNEKSTKKSATKRTIMPNFALIHKKAFEKMENLAEYSERKRQRAQMLLSSNKTGSNRKSISKLHKEKSEEAKFKSSRQLFTNNTNNENKYNRFGFKVTDPTKKPILNMVAKPNTHVAIVKPVIKPSVFARSEVVAIANKNKAVTNNRENRRDMLKGVRTNRRFELLMQMRNK